MTYTPEQLEAVQAVVDRVSSYQDSAPEGTVAAQLQEGLTASGVTVPDADVAALAAAIEAHEASQDTSVQAADVLPAG